MTGGGLVVWLFTLGMAGVFLVAWIRALSELGKVERERDGLWDELYAVTCRGDEDCIAGYGHVGEHRYPSWLDYDPVSRALNAVMLAEESLERLNAIRRQQRVRMQPLSRAEKWRAIWWGFTHPFADPRKVRTNR